MEGFTRDSWGTCGLGALEFRLIGPNGRAISTVVLCQIHNSLNQRRAQWCKHAVVRVQCIVYASTHMKHQASYMQTLACVCDDLKLSQTTASGFVLTIQIEKETDCCHPKTCAKVEDQKPNTGDEMQPACQLKRKNLNATV